MQASFLGNGPWLFSISQAHTATVLPMTAQQDMVSLIVLREMCDPSFHLTFFRIVVSLSLAIIFLCPTEGFFLQINNFLCKNSE